MCLAIPAQVVSCLDNDRAIIDLEGIQQEVSLALLSDVHVGDFVIIHVGFAIGKLDQEEAKRTLALLKEASRGATTHPHQIEDTL